MNKLQLLFLELQMLLNCNNNKNIEEKIGNLYLKYIKLYISIYNNIPDSYQKWHSINNCYFYALNIKTPKIVNYCSNKVADDNFAIDVGSIGNKPFIEEDNISLETFIDCLYADLKYLNIHYYDSAINSSLKYNGYKIAIFYDYTNNLYHFARQNKDGLWSCKHGLEDSIYISDTPLSLINYPNYGYNYEYVKTLEIVKHK